METRTLAPRVSVVDSRLAPTKFSSVILEEAFLFCHVVISGWVVRHVGSFDGAGAILMGVNCLENICGVNCTVAVIRIIVPQKNPPDLCNGYGFHAGT